MFPRGALLFRARQTRGLRGLGQEIIAAEHRVQLHERDQDLARP